MLIKHIFGLLTSPVKEWKVIKSRNQTISESLLPVVVLAAIPPIAAYVGTTQFGWQVGQADPVKLTHESALVIAIMYYMAILAAIFSIGLMIQWMGQTYGANQNFARCLVLAVYIPTPLLLIGILQAYPVLWVNMIVSLPALAYTVLLLYTGIPVLMEIPEERGFLFSSAVLAFGLCGLVGILVVTVFLWGIGIQPVFTS